MYYRYYRRKHRLAIIVLFLLGVYYFSKTSKNDEIKIDEVDSVALFTKQQDTNLDRKHGADFDLEQPVKKIRVNMQNYEPPAHCLVCPGENGHGVDLSGEENAKLPEVNKKEFFNLIASDKMSLWRSLPDVRNQLCREKKYANDLPSASVIIVFRNERLSPLLRTVYSVMNRSPRHLLVEIILVDDDSEYEELKNPLTKYCDEHFGDAVKILRPPKRIGFIAGKNLGAREAKGDAIVFLEPHCEVSPGWLEPILARLKEKPNTILCPIHDRIGDQSLAYYPDFTDYGGFKWDLAFEWADPPNRFREFYNMQIDPFPTPTMVGLVAANRNYWFEIGGYDDGMKIMGEESIELSFRTWMCGGSVEVIPCSHIGHLYRSRRQTDVENDYAKIDYIGYNAMRIAEVWMDDYKRLFYLHRNDLIGKPYGDVQSRIDLKKRLNCKSFKWYLETIFTDKFVPDEKVHGYGQLKNRNTAFCIDDMGKEEGNVFVGLYECSSKSLNQFFSWSYNDEIRHEDYCLVAENTIGNKPKLLRCDGNEDQKWHHTKNGEIIHRQSGYCLDASKLVSSEPVKMQKCEKNAESQMWEFQYYID